MTKQGVTCLCLNADAAIPLGGDKLMFAYNTYTVSILAWLSDVVFFFHVLRFDPLIHWRMLVQLILSTFSEFRSCNKRTTNALQHGEYQQC